MIICSHPYINPEVINLCVGKADRIIMLPDVNYKFNLFSGLMKAHRFLKEFDDQINPILDQIMKFTVISDCSAYLPVNLIISALKRKSKFKELVAIRQDYAFGRQIDIPGSLMCILYSFLLRTNLVWRHKLASFLYFKEPRDRIIGFLSAFGDERGFGNGAAANKTFFFYRPLRGRLSGRGDIVIIYSDRQLDSIGCDLSIESNVVMFKRFYDALFDHYKDCQFICKPHPQDKGRAMPGLDSSRVHVYTGGLTSQMHLESIAGRVRACYAVISSSLIYSASRGIPSYVFYKCIGINLPDPRLIFENDEALKAPYLCNLDSLDKIGCIDDMYVETGKKACENNFIDWIDANEQYDVC
ncbi:MAG: hypothetical protein KBC23_01550 [Candidatus Omnitrophica bacterium]|nr:hypothetical protein [Candidatus Omnitrophota bacterium]